MKPPGCSPRLSPIRTPIVSPREAIRYLRDHGVGRAIAALLATYVYGRQRLHLTHADLLAMASRPLKMDGLEIRRVRPDDPLAETFADLVPSTIARWSSPDHLWFLALHDGKPVAYRCVARTVGPFLRPFLRLRPHQLIVVNDYTRPESRRLGVMGAMRTLVARELVGQGFRESWTTELPTNYPTLSGTDRTGIERSTLIRRCLLGRVRFSVTPAATLSADLVRRQLELLQQVVPRLSRAGILFNPSVTRAGAERVASTRAAAASLGVDLTVFEVREASDQVAALERAFSAIVDAGIGALLVLSDPMLRDHRRAIVSLVERHRLPAVYDAKDFVDVGGLLSYGAPPPCLHDIDSVSAYLDEQKRALVDATTQGRAQALAVSHTAAARLGLTLPARFGP
jgi:hypothetical protein